MKNSKIGLFLALLAAALLVLVAAQTASAAATITIVNVNAPGVGFNDPTPLAPVGGNPGTTLGQQRLNAFTKAAEIWGGTLDSSVEITIQASFVGLTCTPTSAVLGSAGAIQVVLNSGGGGIPPFPGLEANTLYGTALANKRLGFDAIPGPTGTSADDIRARFNSNIGLPGCLTGINWYYGFDGNHGANIDLVTVLLHEFAHGLNFQSFASVSTGALLGGFDDVYEKRILDLSTGKTWPEMTERRARGFRDQPPEGRLGRPGRHRGGSRTSSRRALRSCTSAARPPSWATTRSAPPPSARRSRLRGSPARSCRRSIPPTPPGRRPSTAARRSRTRPPSRETSPSWTAGRAASSSR